MIWGGSEGPEAEDVVLQMRPYIEAHLADEARDGGKLSHVTKHMLGLFAGRPGARPVAPPSV